MHKKFLFTIVVALIIVTPASLLASGFGYYEQGAKATGMAGAFVATADDASAIYYNPAGIAFLEGTNFYGNFAPVKPNTKATFMTIETEGDTPWVPVGAGYIAHSITDSIKAGIGVFAPYGLEVRWPENWIGSAISQRVYMATIFIRPTVAFKLNENFAIGAGVDIVYSKLTLEQQNDFSISPLLPSGRNDVTIDGDGTGYGFTIAALGKLSEKIQFGIKYQHEVEIDYEGDVDFMYTASGHPLVDGTAAVLLADQGVKTTITMPYEFVAGISFKPSEKFQIETDFQYTGWSSYESLAINFDNAMLNFEDDGNWDDTFMVRIGAQYEVKDGWMLRGGYIYDESPIPDETLKPILPDATRNEIVGGFGYDTKESCCWGRFTFDTALQYLMFEDRDSKYPAFPASYEADAYIFTVGFGITWY